MSRPISRVLSWTIIHLGLSSPITSSDLPESSAGRTQGFLFGLAPGGVYTAMHVTVHAVRSYRTFSPLPNHTSLSTHLTVVLRTSRLIWRYIFCCTSRRLAPPRRYLAPCSAEPGLSSDPVLERRKATKEELGPAIAQLTRAQLSRVQNFAQAASTLVSRA